MGAEAAAGMAEHAGEMGFELVGEFADIAGGAQHEEADRDGPGFPIGGDFSQEGIDPFERRASWSRTSRKTEFIIAPIICAVGG